MPQNEYMDRWRKLHGRRLDHEERTRKKAAREGHKASEDAQKLTGLRAKLYQKKRHHEKIQMKKQIKAHEERNVKSSAPNEPSSTPLPQYLLDRSNPTNAKALSSKAYQIHLSPFCCGQGVLLFGQYSSNDQLLNKWLPRHSSFLVLFFYCYTYADTAIIQVRLRIRELKRLPSFLCLFRRLGVLPRRRCSRLSRQGKRRRRRVGSG